MNTEISCPILFNEKFSKEFLSDLVTSLEQLETVKATIFNRLNTAFQERVKKLENLKGRIIRANQIIASFANIPDAITLKSKYHYPQQKHNYYIPTTIDQNVTKINEAPPPKINKIVLHDKDSLGTKSTAQRDRIDMYDNYLQFATQYNDVVNELDKVYKQEQNVQQTMAEVEPILNNVTSDFTFGTKMKIEYVRKSQYNPIELNSRPTTNAILQEFRKEKKEMEEKKKRTIQDAPKSIAERTKMKRRRIKGKKLISKKNASVIEFNIPTNINMGGVSNLNAVDEDE